MPNLRDTVIVWNPYGKEVRLIPLGCDFKELFSWGACNQEVRTASKAARANMLVNKYICLLIRDGVDPVAAFNTFSRLEEFENYTYF